MPQVSTLLTSVLFLFVFLIAQLVCRAEDLDSNPGGGLTQVTQCMNRREEITSCKSYIASVSLIDWCIMILKKKLKKTIVK